MLRMAKPCVLLGVWGHDPLRNFLKIVQFDAFWSIFGSDLDFKKIKKLPFFDKKNLEKYYFCIIKYKYFRYMLAMG